MCEWCAQSQSEENDDATAEPIALANGDVKAQWPWRLKWADSNGGTRLYVEPSTTAQQLHFAGTLIPNVCKRHS